MSDDGSERILVDRKGALWGGAFAAGMVMTIVYLVGVASGAESRQLLEASLPTIRFFGSAVLAAAATILALMLTLLSLSETTEAELNETHWARVKQISLFTSVAIVASVFLLLFLGVPIQESGNVPTAWYAWIYYVLMSLAALVGGLLVTIVIMLYKAVTGFIGLISSGGEAPSHMTTD